MSILLITKRLMPRFVAGADKIRWGARCGLAGHDHREFASGSAETGETRKSRRTSSPNRGHDDVQLPEATCYGAGGFW
jgi:hypothetical protein